MGGALSRRMLAARYRVCGYDPATERAAALRVAGGVDVARPADVAHACPRILLSLPDGNVVRTVLDDLLPALRPGQVVVDTTTAAPHESEATGARLAAIGVAYLDATISGNSEQVGRAETVVMAGGDPATFARCTDLFACFARRAFHVGPVGAGARMKLVTNLVLGLNRAVLAEGLAFARKLGLDPAEALAVLQETPAHSRVMEVKGPRMIAGDFTPAARLSQHLKDVRLMLAAGAEAGARLPLSELHRALLEEAEAAGLGGADNSAILRVFEGS